MTSKILLRILAVAAAELAPLAAAAQVNSDSAPGPLQAAPLKYEAYVGLAYSRIRQVPVTYSGLIGGKVSLARDWGKYFQLLASGDYYKMGTGHSYLTNPGSPSIYSFLVGPGVRFPVYGRLGGVLFTELGLEHTGGESMTPNISFAGGFGGGLTYNLNRRFALQLTGDRVAASFSLPSNSPQVAYSTHRTWDARGTGGLVVHF